MIEINDERWEKVASLTGFAGNECYQCGVCSAVCPIDYMGGESLNIRSELRGAQIGLEPSENLWNCATCKMCEVTCPRQVDIVHVVHGLRQLAFEDRRSPDKITKLVWDIYENGNPWGGKKSDRSKWAEGLDIKDANSGADVLLFVGCDAAYNKSLHNSLRSLANIMKKAGINFGTLGNEEKCCGEPVKNSGEEGFLEELVDGNISKFEETGAKTIVAFSPHCANMFSTYYADRGMKIDVKHYSEYINELLQKGKIKLSGNGTDNVTIHDPCYLSRYEDKSGELRDVIKSIPDMQVSEMQQSGKQSLCCGGGGNRMFMDFEGKRLSDFRIDQAKEAGSDTIITACPVCNMNLADSIKVNFSDLKVKELAELIDEAVE